MNNFTCVLFYFILFTPHYSWGGNVDIKVEIDPLLISDVSNGDSGEFSITITNNGPDDIGLGSQLTHPVSIGSDRIYLEETGGFVSFFTSPNKPQDCVLSTYIIDPIPGELVSIIYTFHAPNIAANDSVICYGNYSVNFENGFHSLTWRSLVAPDIDINPSNDSVTMFFQGNIRQVSSFSTFGLILLTLFIATLAYRFKTKLH